MRRKSFAKLALRPALFLLTLGAVAFALYYFLDLGDAITFEKLRSYRGVLLRYSHHHPVDFAIFFSTIYIFSAIIPIPITAILTLAAGVVFGFWQGTLIVTVAGTVGATLAFLLARHYFHAILQTRFSKRTQAIQKGFARDGLFYLLTLRMVPVFPFFLLNLLMGITPIRTWAFVWGSFLGMLAANMVFINAGTQLRRIRSVDQILSPKVIISLLLLGLVPLLSRLLIRKFSKPEPVEPAGEAEEPVDLASNN